MKFQFLQLFLKIFLFMTGYFFLHQNLATAENVPPPPPLPSGNQTVNTKTAPAKQRLDVATPAPRPPSKKKKGSLTPEITIVPKRYETRAEYRVNDILYMIKIRPKSRTDQTYYLIDQHGDGVFVRSNFKPKNTIPKWVLERSN